MVLNSIMCVQRDRTVRRSEEVIKQDFGHDASG